MYSYIYNTSSSMMTSLFIFFSVKTCMQVRFFKNSAWKTSLVSSASLVLIYSYIYVHTYYYIATSLVIIVLGVDMHTHMHVHTYIHTCIHTRTYIYQLYKKAISNAAATGPVFIDYNTSKALLPVFIHAHMWLSLQK